MGPEYIEASRAGLACSGSGRKPLDAVEEREYSDLNIFTRSLWLL